MGKIPSVLRETISRNIREQRMKKFPGRGGGKKCAEAFGVSPQQWSPWERGMRTPDETRLQQMADFFGTTVEELRRDNSARKHDAYAKGEPAGAPRYPGPYPDYAAPALREPELAGYRVPSFRREESHMSPVGIGDLAIASSRLLGLVGVTTKGAAEGRFEMAKTVAALRGLGDILEERLRDAENQPGRPAAY